MFSAAASSRRTRARIGLPLAAFVLAAACARGGDEVDPLPVQGIHLSAPAKADVDAFTAFVGQVLSKRGVNTLVLEFGYRFDYRSRPEFSDPSAPGKTEAARIAKACRDCGIELIPELNCLGHQSWGKTNGRLLEKHPELDETPGKHAGNQGIYCRSYCPLHPKVHEIVFALIDELAEACESKAFHVGLDEVFLLADPDCPRCRGKDPAELFAGEVKALHAHLKESGRRLWLWGDRLLDGKATGIGKWEASENGTHRAIDLIPKDVVVCDWHYEKAHPTLRHFAEKGFEVVACPWKEPSVALAQLEQVRALRAARDVAVGRRALGVVQTTWCGFGPFARSYEALESGKEPEKGNAAGAARSFRSLFPRPVEGRASGNPD
jgi:hypothetical protein